MPVDKARPPVQGVRFKWSLLHPRHLGSWLGLLLAFFLSLLPQRARHYLGRLIGLFLYRYHAKRRNVVAANLTQAFPEVTVAQRQVMIREHLGWYGKALVDYSLFFFGSRRRLLNLVSIVDEVYLTRLSEKQPVILLLTHSVMLEFAVVALAANYKSFGSYKASSNPVLDWMVARSRCRFTDFVVSRDEGLRPLIRAIKSKRVMVFLPDEDLGLDNAVFAPFFGRQKATLSTPARLARLGGAGAVAGFVAYNNALKKYQLHLTSMPDVYPSGEASTDALALNQALETLIRKYPEQYLWVMKWYKTARPQDKQLY